MNAIENFAGLSDPARQAVSDGENHGSALLEGSHAEERAVTQTPAEEVSAPPQVRNVEAYSQLERMAAANRYLVLEVNAMARQLAVARIGMRLLETVSHDWNEAADVIKQWKEVTK